MSMVYVSDSKDWNYLYRSVAVKSLPCQKPIQLNQEMKVDTLKGRLYREWSKISHMK